MHEVVDLSELEERPGEMVERVVRDGTQYILARDGHPEAALISYEELSRLRRIEEREHQFLERWEQMRAEMAALNDQYSEEEVAADVEAAREEVAAEWRARGR
jgi:prevent-host-death family protein